LLVEARTAVDPTSTPVILRDVNREQQRRFVAEAFFNQRCYFVMFAASHFRIGRRINAGAG